MSRWYPNADGLKCAGSFQTVSTDVAGRERDSNGKVRVPCPWCQKLVGLRSKLKGSRGVLQQHRRPNET